MKRILLISIYLLVIVWAHSANSLLSSKGSTSESITILCSPDLFNLAQDWVNEYSQLNRDVNIKLLNLEISRQNEISTSDVVLYLVSSEFQRLVNKGTNWKMVIGTDAIVPIINATNPVFEKINSKGISTETIGKVISTSEKETWGKILSDANEESISVYTIDNEYIIDGLKDFGNVREVSTNLVKLPNSEELVAKVQQDKYAIGFCKLYSIIDFKSNEFVNNIKLLPIDVNGNGKVDYSEKIYGNLSDFLRGLMIGKYPKAISENLYLITNEKPSNDTEVAFISWLLTEGQKFLNTNGFADLAYNQRKSSVDKITEEPIHSVNETNFSFIIPLVILVLGAMIGLFFTIGYAVQRIRNSKIKISVSKVSNSIFNENSIEIPNGLYYDKTHTWAFMKRDGTVEIGLDDFMQHITGSITRIKMKDPGEKIRKGEILLSIIQDGKQLNIYSPISGEIKACNLKINNDTSLFNNTPYTEGWIYAIEPSNWIWETQFLVVAEKYKEWIKNEYLRFKDFLTNNLNANNLDYRQVVLQDGGEIKDHVLRNLGPEVWEDFQTKFIDSAK